MKNGLDNFMRLGYAIIIVSVALMIWASSARAVKIPDQPCTFSSLCECTQHMPESFGSVKCVNVPHPMIPREINMSKVYSLRMDNTGLMDVQNDAFYMTGLYRIEIINNEDLFDVPDGAFNGLERSLVELTLKNNRLIDIPTKAMRYLVRLRSLDLSGNEISVITRDSFRGLQDSLENLNLADNAIRSLPMDTFHGLPKLISIDLSSNNLREITPDVFREQMDRLERVNFADNLLVKIPYVALSLLSRLKFVDLSSNQIDDFDIEIASDYASQPNVKLSLDELHLEHNEISLLKTGSFQYIATANKTFLDFNPIHIVGDSAFQAARIRELYMRHCKLDFVEPTAFSGLESSLQILDMTGNNITTLPEKVLRLDFLSMLNVKDNLIRSILPQSTGFTSDVQRLDVSGDRNDAYNLQELRRFNKLRTLTVGKLTQTSLSPEDFYGYGAQLENLRIYRGNLRTIKAHAFIHVRSIKRLDLSENMIDTIEKGAFQDIGLSLTSLRISHGFSSSMSQFPDHLRELEAIREIDFSNNKLRTLNDLSFYFLKNLELINLNDNQIEVMPKGTFQADVHRKLEEISIEFNSLKNIITHSFVDLERLHTIKLRDNKIERIERRAFMNLNKLTYLSLRGNKIMSIADEAFENLPQLRLLDLSYNKLKIFDFDYFDQVGTLSHLSVNVSHNLISDLTKNQSASAIGTYDHQGHVHSDIKVLDLSFNNISAIDQGYFRMAEGSLVQLNLGHNYIMNISREVFGNLFRLSNLDLSYNYIDYVSSMTFINSKKIQVLDLSNNGLREFATEAFKNIDALRIVDLSSNNLRYIPDSAFSKCRLEKVDLSNNEFTRIPSTGFTNLATMDLVDLDLSNNQIGSANNGTVSMTLSSQHLARLDLSYNRIERFEDAAFATLPNLSILDLSHNEELEVYGRVFRGLENCLKELRLNNISLIQAPELSLPKLRHLEIAHNGLPSVQQELAANLTSIRNLDISFNDLPSVPLLVHSLPNLKSLSVAGNPITTLTNSSFLGAADTLESLNVGNLHLQTVENGFLNNFDSLRELIISPYPNVKFFNIPSILEDVDSLRILRVESPVPRIVKVVSREGVETYQVVQDSAGDLHAEMYGPLPRKTRDIIISGTGFDRLAEEIFDGIRSSSARITIFNTTLSGLPPKIFQKVGDAFNISINIDSNNKRLSSMPNPHSAMHLNMADKVYLTDLNIQFTSLSCDCEVGWIEFWQRIKRQHFCSSVEWPDDVDYRTQLNFNENCDDIYPDDEDYRTTKCSNKNSEALIEVLKNDLECGWSSASQRNVNLAISLIVTFTLILSLM